WRSPSPTRRRWSGCCGPCSGGSHATAGSPTSASAPTENPTPRTSPGRSRTGGSWSGCGWTEAGP
ncbi:MAG: hypothetical protein AVDCRST_MAG19-1974, partial [uncultured Thermomicrobiales bacterium]